MTGINDNFGHELDFASGFFTVYELDRKNPGNKEYPYLSIDDDCPEDIRIKLLETWERVKKETIERHEAGQYSSLDYFW